MKITIGHTHDADDAFMFYALLNKKIDTGNIEFEDYIEPITVLNKKSRDAVYDMTAVSAAFLPQVSGRYDVLTTGACMAEKRGPVLIFNKKSLIRKIAVPGLNTTAYYSLRIYNNKAECIVHPFDKILSAVLSGEFDAGILINEDQMLLEGTDLESIDLGLWWREKFGLPLPLGVDIVRSNLPEDIKNKINSVFKESIQFALNNQDEAIDYALTFGRGIKKEKGREFVSTFVNKYTVSPGNILRESISCLLELMKQNGLIKGFKKLNFIEPNKVDMELL